MGNGISSNVELDLFHCEMQHNVTVYRAVQTSSNSGECVKPYNYLHYSFIIKLYKENS